MSFMDAQHAEPAGERVYLDVYQWVTRWLAHHYRRNTQHHYAWCPAWWHHPEAVERLTVLHELWEATHRTPSKYGDWWLNHLDPTMAILLDERGPFSACSRGHRDGLEPLPGTHPSSSAQGA